MLPTNFRLRRGTRCVTDMEEILPVTQVNNSHVENEIPEPVLGLRQNVARFSLLVLVNAFVGGMAGLERAILPPVIAGLTFASGTIVALRMGETRKRG